jgi:hypothetical protein
MQNEETTVFGVSPPHPELKRLEPLLGTWTSEAHTLPAGDPLRNGLSVEYAVVLAAIAVVATVIAAMAFDRRDVGVST